MKTIGEFAAELYAAPAWLLVESVTIEEEGGDSVRVALGDLDRMPFPDGSFTLRVNIRSSTLVKALDGSG